MHNTSTHNTSTQWGWLAKSFHWVMALMVAIIVPVGFVMTGTYQYKVASEQMLNVHIAVSRVHHTLGLLVLFLVVLRLGWRLKNTTPEMPPALSVFQNILAKLNHGFLYVLLFLLPLSGWAAMSSFGEAPMYFFWTEWTLTIMPKLPLDHMFGYAFFGRMHVYAVYAGGVLLTLHIAAALWHQFVKKDSVLRRMWPLAAPH